MKRLLTILIAAASIFSGSVFAQIQNGNFEQLNSDGKLSYWGRTYLFNVSIDTTGEMETDSLVFDGPFYAPTNDAHSGNWAVELRNAYNFTTWQGFDGGIGSYADSVFVGFSMYNYIDASQQPTAFGFYYKYFPAETDMGYASLAVYDSTFNMLGTSVILIANVTVSDYQYIYAPIDYFTPGTVAYYTLDFSTAAPCAGITLGTRLLIDDAQFIYSTNGIDENESASVEVFPNPTNGIINIAAEQVNQVYVYNSVGKIVKTANTKTIDVSDLSNGVYYLKTIDKNHKSSTVKIIKN